MRRNRSHRDETFKLKLLRWRRRVLPPGLPAVHSKFQRHRLSTSAPYPRSMAKDRRSGRARPVRPARMLERAKGIEPSYAAWEAALFKQVNTIAAKLALSSLHRINGLQAVRKTRRDRNRTSTPCIWPRTGRPICAERPKKIQSMRRERAAVGQPLLHRRVRHRIDAAKVSTLLPASRDAEVG